jgi:hypothetical protein|tara:strand:- start:538 stop:717 length:180 start_codon:yes stop_codon:yes gene_type:complete
VQPVLKETQYDYKKYHGLDTIFLPNFGVSHKRRNLVQFYRLKVMFYSSKLINTFETTVK